MKNNLLLSVTFLVGIISFTNGQTTTKQTPKGLPDHHLRGGKISKPAQVDSAYILLDYSTADQAIYSSYQAEQGQLINNYYRFPKDTANSYKASTMFYQNYDCINTAIVAFDSLYAVNYAMGFSPGAVNSLLLDTIYVPIVQVNNSHQKDTLKLQLITIDAQGYPSTTPLLSTLFIGDTIGYGNDGQIKVLKWCLNYYSLSGTKFAIKLDYYDASKLDSCWFIYGFGSVPDACPNKVTGGVFAKNTHFSKVTETPPFIANSFVQWNEYTGYGLFPDRSGNNVYYPCDTSKHTYDTATDGATYFQNINIMVTAAMNFTVGIPTLHSPLINVSQNYPNPFNETSVITYSLSKSSEVSFKVTDLTGREVYVQNYGTQTSGEHTITLNANELNAGVYFYSISSLGSTITKKMVIYQ